MTNTTLQELKQKIQKILPEKFNIDMKKVWEETFYDSDWEPDSFEYTEQEKKIVEELSYFLPRHMDVYDWNLPYIDKIILIIRRNYITITLSDVLRAIEKFYTDCGIITKEPYHSTFIELLELWNLEKDSLDLQEEATIDWLNKIIK